MSNYIMKVDFFGNDVRCETEGNMVCLNDLIIAGNVWRNQNGLSSRKLQDITQTQGFANFVATAAKMRNCKVEDMYHIAGRGRTARTNANILIAIYVAEQMSPEFHVKVIDTFLYGKLLEFRELGGTEFKQINAAIDAYLPGRENKESNKGIFINVAKLIREKILGKDATTESWNHATVDQTQLRYSYERDLSTMLRLGTIKDYDHLKEVIEKL